LTFKASRYLILFGMPALVLSIPLQAGPACTAAVSNPQYGCGSYDWGCAVTTSVPGDCSSALAFIKEAINQLEDAAPEEDVEDAQPYAAKAYKAFEDAEDAANNCGCHDAAATLAKAAKQAKLSKNAAQLDEFANYSALAVKYGNAAMKELEKCSESL
jgi:hypothetical protein